MLRYPRWQATVNATPTRSRSRSEARTLQLPGSALAPITEADSTPKTTTVLRLRIGLSPASRCWHWQPERRCSRLGCAPGLLFPKRADFCAGMRSILRGRPRTRSRRAPTPRRVLEQRQARPRLLTGVWAAARRPPARLPVRHLEQTRDDVVVSARWRSVDWYLMPTLVLGPPGVVRLEEVPSLTRSATTDRTG